MVGAALTATAPPPSESFVAGWRVAVNAIATFLVVFGAGLLLTATAPRLFGYDSVVVSSGSMSPRIRTGDVVITSDVTDIDLGPGRVIDFERNGSTVLHRIVEVTDDGFVTSGDANPARDSGVVTADDVRGVGIVRVPGLGWPALWMASHQWLQLAVLCVVATSALYVSRLSWLVSANVGSASDRSAEEDDESTDENPPGTLSRIQPYTRAPAPSPSEQPSQA